jgi:hypothetical protein
VIGVWMHVVADVDVAVLEDVSVPLPDGHLLHHVPLPCHLAEHLGELRVARGVCHQGVYLPPVTGRVGHDGGADETNVLRTDPRHLRQQSRWRAVGR